MAIKSASASARQDSTRAPARLRSANVSDYGEVSPEPLRRRTRRLAVAAEPRRRTPAFRLRFRSARIPELAARFDAAGDEAILDIGRAAQRAGFFTRDQFLQVAKWKTPRSQPRCQLNEEGFVRAVTHTALTTPSERLRIEVSTLLQGVDWPTASVLLHFGHKEPYPILDVRALWSAGLDRRPIYRFELWWAYVEFCRKIASEALVSMRTLDRALWQYSSERQG